MFDFYRQALLSQFGYFIYLFIYLFIFNQLK